MKEKRNSRNEIQKSNACDAWICSFDRYLESVRGLSLSTRKHYCSYVRVFILFQLKTKKQINSLRARNVIKFILSYTRDGGPRRAQSMIYSLRSFFRFLKQTKVLKEDLADCVPSVAVWKHRTFPVFLSIQEMQKLLSSCNKNSEIGLRDFAVLMLLVQLGLRASEVCRLTLDDIDWDRSEIIIHGKDLTETRLPILRDLGNALVAYLKHGRPDCSNRSFFICIGHPLRGFKSSAIVRSILRAALMRAGLNPEKKGAHLLRHSFAMQMLQQGATFQEIGAILRHKSISTTAIYAKVDFDKLRILSLPWPHILKGGGSL